MTENVIVTGQRDSGYLEWLLQTGQIPSQYRGAFGGTTPTFGGAPAAPPPPPAGATLEEIVVEATTVSPAAAILQEQLRRTYSQPPPPPPPSSGSSKDLGRRKLKDRGSKLEKRRAEKKAKPRTKLSNRPMQYEPKPIPPKPKYVNPLEVFGKKPVTLARSPLARFLSLLGPLGNAIGLFFIPRETARDDTFGRPEFDTRAPFGPETVTVTAPRLPFSSPFTSAPILAPLITALPTPSRPLFAPASPFFGTPIPTPSSPRPTPSSPTSPRPLVSPFAMPNPSQGGAPRPPTFPPLTPTQLAGPQSPGGDSGRNRCKPCKPCKREKKKRKQDKCTNPITARRTFTRDGQRFRTITRKLQCRVSSSAKRR